LDPAAVPFEVIQVDLLRQGAVEQILETSRPDWVIHCAALANLDACEMDPKLAVQMNTELPAQLAVHVARGGARLLHISTDSVFDGTRGGYTEEDLPNPPGVYSRTKLAGEQAVLQANSQACVARVNLFGWGITGKRSLAEFFFNHLKAGKTAQGFTDVFFCPILANDMAFLMEAMFENNLTGLYHLVGREGLSKYEFGLALARRFGFDENLIQPASVFDAGLKAARSPNLILRTEKLAAALHQQMPRLDAGLDRFYNLYQQGYPHYLRNLLKPAG
jgi:dTDP-4-dehydrorhamnose reductase